MFDFREEGAAYVTMKKTGDDILEGRGVDKCSAAPATDNLFVVREARERSNMVQALYIAKRVK